MRRMIAVAAALALSAAGLMYLVASGGVADMPMQSPRSMYPSNGEVASWHFMAGEYDGLRERGDAPELILGSSELKSKSAGPAHPARLFSDGRYGMSSVIVGRAGINDLWQAIEVGAFAPHMPRDRRRAVLFVSMQWFMCYRDPKTSFPAVFSQGAYDALMANPNISGEVKRRVAKRVSAYGVDVADATAGDPLARAAAIVDRRASLLISDLRLALALRTRGRAGSAASPTGPAVKAATRTCPPALCGARRGADEQGREPGPATPDWDALMSEGRERAARASAGNDFGFYDSWYRRAYRGWLDGARQKWHVEGDGYWSGEELEDFKLTLEICHQTGVEPLVVIQPVKGAAYDQTIYTREVRTGYYDMIRSACAAAGVRVADFSDREYDALFLRDYSHPSAYGSACYSQAIWDFWTR